jgi:hypothetical protein
MDVRAQQETMQTWSEDAATAVDGQEGGTEGWLAAPDADGSHRALAFVRGARGIVGGVVRLLAVDGEMRGQASADRR